MRVPLLFVAMFFPLTAAAQQQPPHVAETPKLSPEEEAAKIHVPPGFELQLVTCEPHIRKPMNICFDDRGRLWVTDTIEYPYPARGREGRDRVVILDDFDATGRAKNVTVFADGLNIPIGLHPYADGCIVYSIPHVWRLRDTDGDGKADKREILYSLFGQDDTHGMVNSFTIGLDGWLYACHGYRNDSKVRGADGKELLMNSGNTFRMRLDGSHCESFTRGQVNPFGLAWDAQGNLYSADCHSMPLTQLLRGATYQSFSKPHDGLGFAPHMIDFGKEHSTALCGAVFYDASHFDTSYRGRMFIGDVVMNRVNSYDLTWSGSSPSAKYREFLKSDDPWFRPVDLKLGPDGALYIADFYNRIIGHYEVPLNHKGRDRDSGRIWRAVKAGTPAQMPYRDLRTEPMEKLTALLGHDNLTVRMQATHALVDRGPAVVEAVAKVTKPKIAQCHALWVLERLGKLTTESLHVATTGEPTVAVHALRILAERREWSDADRQAVVGALKNSNPMVQRMAAEALGLHPSPATLRPLIAARAAAAPSDLNLIHVLRLALRNHLREAEVWTALTGDLPAETSATIADVIPGAPSSQGAEFLARQLQRPDVPIDRRLSYVQFIARHGDDSTCRLLVQKLQRDGNLISQHAHFSAYHRGTQERGKALSDDAKSWSVGLCDRLLASRESEMKQAGANLAASVGLVTRQDALLQISNDTKNSASARAAALAALAQLDSKHLTLLGQVARNANELADLRERTVRALGSINSGPARQELALALATAPAALASVIGEVLAATGPGANVLLTAIEQGKASPRLLLERGIEVRLQQARLPNLKDRVGKVTQGLPPADARLTELLKSRRERFTSEKSDSTRGAKVYTQHCAACHQLAGQGAKIGPQLDGIGARGLDRLLEDTLDPNRNVDPNFRSTRITLKNGRDLNGFVLREEGAVVILADHQGKETRIEKSTIEERTITPLSPMPANWAELIPPTDFNDLLAYLLSQRGK